MPDVIFYHNQGGRQLAAIVVTLAISIPSGLLTGMLLKHFEVFSDKLEFSDTPYWEVAGPPDSAPEDDAPAGATNNAATAGDTHHSITALPPAQEPVCSHEGHEHGHGHSHNNQYEAETKNPLADPEVRETVKHVRL